MPDSQPSTSMKILGHPPGLFLLFFVEMWERFSYYGMRALLVLYLVQKLDPVPDATGWANPGRGWSEESASVLYGWYSGLAYLLPMLGGMIADKWIGTHRSMLLGGMTIALGHIALAVSGLGGLDQSPLGMSIFIGGLALIICGTGFFKPCVSVMVGQLYPERDPRRDAAFTIFYMGINLGAFLCTFVCGTLGERVGWHWGFGAAAVGMLAGLAMYGALSPTLLRGIGEPPAPVTSSWLLLLPASLGISAVVAVMFHLGAFHQLQSGFERLGNFGNQLIIGMLVASIIAAVLFTLNQAREDRGPTASIFIFMVFNIFFWMAFEQAGSSMNLFAQQKTERNLYGGWEMPASWLQSVNAGCILLLGPVFAALWPWLGKRGMNPSQPIKIGAGLLFLGAGFAVLTWGAAVAAAPGAKAALSFLVLTYVLHTVGELCLSPTGLSYVTKAAPVRYMSLLMGIWFASNFVANLSGGLIAAKVKQIEEGKIKLPWHFGGQADFFFLFVVTSFGAGLLILLMTPLLKPLIGDRDD